MTTDTSNLNIPLTEKLKSLPGIFGIRLGEGPSYDVVLSDGHFEIRQYRPFVLASITCNGSYQEATKEAFLSLANYIFGQNKDQKNLKMSTLVFQEATGNGWTLSFILPFKFTLATAPTPKDKRITLQKKLEHTVATIKYSGINNEEKIKKYSAELTRWLSKKHLFIPTGDIQAAQYDGPTTIPFLRKNEIHIEVTSIQ